VAAPLISVVVRSFNEQNHIERLLIGVLEQSIPEVEVILVDSGSTDQTLSIAGHYPIQIHTIKPNEFSFGGSLNLGCRAAKGEFIVLASAHVYPVYNDWLVKLTAPFEDPTVALVYGKQRGNETTKYSEHQIFSKWFPNQSNLRQDHPFCNNANAAIRRSAWEQIPYDETLTALEDIDWAKRTFKLARKIAYVADAEVIHIHHETLKKVFNRYRREAIAMKRIFPEESFSLWDFIRLFAANSTNDAFHAGIDHVLWKNVIDILGFRMMQFWGTYLGYTQRGPISHQLRQTFYYPASLSQDQRVDEPSDLRIPIQYTQEETHEPVVRCPRYISAAASRHSHLARQ
jgi:rhamnosyltransferase